MDKQAFNHAFDLGIREIATNLEKKAALGTALLGATVGAATAGEGNRMKGALAGGVVGVAGGAAGKLAAKLSPTGKAYTKAVKAGQTQYDPLRRELRKLRDLDDYYLHFKTPGPATSARRSEFSASRSAALKKVRKLEEDERYSLDKVVELAKYTTAAGGAAGGLGAGVALRNKEK